VSALTRAALIDVYDTILSSKFVPRMAALVEPLGIAIGDWLVEWDKLREDRDRGKVTIAGSFARTLTALGREPEPGLLADLLRRNDEYVRTYSLLFDDTVPFLNWLRSEGVLTALVSNCADSTRPQLEHLGVIPLVDAVVLSCEVGSMKPYPEIYATALEELGVAAVDAVFIDDQPAFCVGAEAMGIRPIQIARHEVNGYDSRWNFPVVHSLFDVQSLLAMSPDVRPGTLPFGTLRVRVREPGEGEAGWRRVARAGAARCWSPRPPTPTRNCSGCGRRSAARLT
jgi:HAD superfamily hydrolase (TIGR01509 family)